MRLIDADELISNVFKNDISYNAFKNLVQRQPTVDAVPVVHGEWIPVQRPNGRYYTGCSVCSFPIPTDSMFDYMDETDNRFCYNCGASMDGKEQNDG